MLDVPARRIQDLERRVPEQAPRLLDARLLPLAQIAANETADKPVVRDICL